MKFVANPEKFDAQLGCCSFVASHENKKKKIERIELLFSQKNKWEEDWPRYWFYVKIGLPDPLTPEKAIYPFACKVEDMKVVFVPDYDSKLVGFESCRDAFCLAMTMMSGQDVVEEALAANVMPLARGWVPLRMESKAFLGLDKEIPYPRFDLQRPKDRSDEILVAELEREAKNYLGPLSEKELEAAKLIPCHEGRINCPFDEMGICMEPQSKPAKGGKRNRAPSNVGSEGPRKKKAKATASKAKTSKLEKI